MGSEAGNSDRNKVEAAKYTMFLNELLQPNSEIIERHVISRKLYTFTPSLEYNG